MSSVTRDQKGWRIRFVDQYGDRRTIRPGKCNKVTAQQIGRHVDELVACVASNGVLSRQTALWLGEIGDTLHVKLSRVNLVPSRQLSVQPKDCLTLSAFLDDHVDDGRTAKGAKASPATLVKWRPTVTYLKERFPDRLLHEITAEDAYQFRVWLDKRRIKQKTAWRTGKRMTENAKRRHIATCKMFFNAAKRRGLIESNPFEAQVSGSQANRKRDHFVTIEDTRKILDAAPDCQWRLLIALWRLAGLRKMEVFRLTWGDVQWDDGKLRVHSNKTAHLEGYDVRYIPIRDIRQYLEDAFQAELSGGSKSLPAEAPIVTRFSASNSNLDKPFRQIVEAAGLVPWPKLFQNLRSSCETQWLRDRVRPELAASWIGHSVTIQRKHYVQIDQHDIDEFNSESGPHSGPDDTGQGETRRDRGSGRTTPIACKNTDDQRIHRSDATAQNNPARVRTDQ